MRPILSILALVFLQGCATIIEGTTQTVSVATQPAGASCLVERDGHRLGTVGLTPGSLNISKSRNDLVVTCGKDGYQPASLTQPPRFVATTFGNILVGGLVGVVVDATNGANFAYPATVNLSLTPTANGPIALAPAPLNPGAVPVAVRGRVPAVPAPAGPGSPMDDLPPYQPYPPPAAFRPASGTDRRAQLTPAAADPNIAPVRLTGGYIEP